MNKKIYLGVLVLLVPIFLTACTSKNSGNNQSNRGEGNAANNEKGSEVEDLKGSLADLMKLGRSIKCTFGFEDENQKTSGETYVSGTKSRTEFSVETKDETKINTSSIMDDTWMYTWTSGTNQGTKIKISDIDKPSDGNVDTSKDVEEGYVNNKNTFDYKCQTWVPDGSKFTPPTDITFNDLTPMLNQFSNPSNKDSLCGMCNSLEKQDEVAQCKQRLGCE